MSEGKTPRRDALDERLASWPEASRSALEWDRAAEAVGAEAQAGGVAGGLSDDELLAAPLPASSEESREKDRANLKELAKLADVVAPSAPSAAERQREESSGVVHLATLAASEGQTVQGEPLPTAASPAAGSSQGRGTAATAGWWVALVATAAVAAAAGALFMSLRSPATATATLTATATEPATPTSTPIPASDRGVDPSTLPRAGSETETATEPAPLAAHSPAHVAPAPETPADRRLVAVVPAPAPVGAGAPTDKPGTSLETLMHQAVGTPSAPIAPAPDLSPAVGPVSVPLKPSFGAVQGALGAALPAARACLGPDDPISRATVTFQSDGSVQAVSLSGGAAGKPAEGCIRSALMRARVPPFAQPTFTAPATIRPD